MPPFCIPFRSQAQAASSGLLKTLQQPRIVTQHKLQASTDIRTKVATRVQLGPLTDAVRFGRARLVRRLTRPKDAVFWKRPVHVHAR